LTVSSKTEPGVSDTILVTGGAGFTGAYLIKHLEALGHSARTISNIFIENKIDILDKRVVSNFIADFKPTKLIHLAGISRSQSSNREQLWNVNSLGTRNVIEAFLSNSPSPDHFVLASTAQVYSESASPINEDAPVEPQSEYAKSKVDAEESVLRYSGHLKVSIVRPFNYTGLGQPSDFLIPKLVQGFDLELPSISVGNLKVVRDFSDVRDVVSAYAKILNSNESGGVFNVCQGRGISLEELVQRLEELYERRISVEFDSSLARASEPITFIGDHTKISSTLGWFPHFELEDTLLWMKNRH
jgi:nucleoside-diphosphate-sugar epimerase